MVKGWKQAVVWRARSSRAFTNAAPLIWRQKPEVLHAYKCLNPIVFTLICVENLIKYDSPGRAEGLNQGERSGAGSGSSSGAGAGSGAGGALITLPSLRLSATKIIGAQPGGNATSVQQHIPRITGITMVHCAELAWSQHENAPLRQKSSLFCMRGKTGSGHECGSSKLINKSCFPASVGDNKLIEAEEAPKKHRKHCLKNASLLLEKGTGP